MVALWLNWHAAGGGDVGEVARVERLVAKVAGSDGGAPGVPGIGQNVRAAELNAVGIDPGIFKLVVVTRRGVAGRGGCPVGGVGAAQPRVAGIAVTIGRRACCRKGCKRTCRRCRA